MPSPTRLAGSKAEFDFRRTDHGRGDDKSLLWRLRRPVVPAAKRAIRSYGAATASQRVLPDYLIIGAKRGGSTTLARRLVATAGVTGLFPAREELKGTYYFDVNHSRGTDWYRSHFPTRKALGDAVVGEASPYYLSHPHAAERAYQLVPNAKVVAVLRHPVDRAFSHYRERVKQGVETLPSFEAALEAEHSRVGGERERMLEDPGYVSWNHLNFAYRDQSRYGQSLTRWFEHWPADQVLVVRSEDMYADPHAMVNRVRAFIGLDEVVANASAKDFNRLPQADVDASTRAHLWQEFAADQRDLAALRALPNLWENAENERV